MVNKKLTTAICLSLVLFSILFSSYFTLNSSNTNTEKSAQVGPTTPQVIDSSQAHRSSSVEKTPAKKIELSSAPLNEHWKDGKFISSKSLADINRPFLSGEQARRVELITDAQFKYPNIRLEKDTDDDVINAMVADHLLIHTKAGIPNTVLIEKLAQLHLEIRKTIITDQVYLVSLQGEHLVEPDTLELIRDRLSPLSHFLKANEPDYIVYNNVLPNDPDFSYLWGLHQSFDQPNSQDIDAPQAWDINTDASSIVVGVIDTGIDYNHEDLSANMWSNSAEIPGNNLDDDNNGFIDDIHGYDFYNDDGDPMDDQYHGTHCAGTIGAAGNNGVGITGVAWSTQLMALKFLSFDGRGTTSDAISAISYAHSNGAHLTSNSWGGGSFSVTLYSTIDSSGKPFIAAAGNSGVNTDSIPMYPATYNLDNIISVAASDDDDDLAIFSNYGPMTVDLSAPGVYIYSCLPNNNYGMLSGTSMATPHVSGACALLLAENESLTPAQIKLHLLNSIDKVGSQLGSIQSEGRLNLERFLRGNSSTAPVITSSLDQTITVDQSFLYQINTTPQAAWFDVMGLPSGLSFNRNSGEISGAPESEGIYPISLAAGNAGGIGTATLNLNIVGPLPIITSELTASGTQGGFFFYEIQADPQATSFSATNLPAGLSVDPISGIISGTLNANGTFNVSLSATNSSGTDNQTLTLTINLPDPPAITSVLETSGVVNTPFSYQITASNSPTSYSATGLPAGLSVNPSSGLISGTATTGGTNNVTISATNLGGTDSASLELKMNLPDAPVIESALTASGQVGQAFSYQINASNSPSSYLAENLPTGLTIDSATGVISGTPSVAATFEVLIGATNLGGTAKAGLTITVFPMAPTITSPSQHSQNANLPISYQITSSPQANSYAASNLPAGLSLDAQSGLISGTVSEAGAYIIIVSATNSGGSGSQNVTLNILPEVPVLNELPTYSFEVGELINVGLSASNAPTSFSESGIPSGLFMDSSTGQITGTITTLGTYQFQVSATNSGGTDTQTLTIEIIDGPTRITAFSPTVLDPFETVTINGTGFTNASEVYFSSFTDDLVPAVSFTVISDIEIHAQVPHLRMTFNSDLSWIIVNSPQGLAVAYPPSTTEVVGGYDTGGSGGKHLAVRSGGALIGGGGSHKVVIEKGGSARLSSGGSHIFFVGSGGYLDLTDIGSNHTTFHAKDAVILEQPTITTQQQQQFNLVADVRVTIMNELLYVRQLPVIASNLSDLTTIGQHYLYDIELSYNANRPGLSYAAGVLPAGLSFDTASGTLSGYPTTAGVYSIDLSATNNEGTTNFTLELTVTGDPVPVIFGGSKVEGDSGQVLSYQITAYNSPTSYAASGLPAGLSIDGSTGVITGTPTTGGVYTATVSATNSYGTTSRDFTFYIDASALAITSFTPQIMGSGQEFIVTGRGLDEVTEAYFTTRSNAAATGTNITASSETELAITTPVLNHVLYDRSPVLLDSPTRSTVTMPATSQQMTNSGTISSTYTIVQSGVNASTGGSGGLKIYVESGGFISTSGGGGGHLIFLEDGATADMSGGGGGHLVFKSPGATVTGSTTITPVSSLSLSLSSHDLIKVRNTPENSSVDATGNVGEAFTYQIVVRGNRPAGGYSYDASNLPAGLSLSASPGLITGTPTLSGTFTVELTAARWGITGTKEVTFTIGNAPLPALTSNYRLDITAGSAISHQMTASSSPINFTTASLPSGLTLSSSGLLTGTLPSAGVHITPVDIANAHGAITVQLVISVDRPLPSVTSVPAVTSPSETFVMSGNNLELIDTVYFSDWNRWDNLSPITTQSTSSLSVIVPDLNSLHIQGTMLVLTGEGGATVTIPDTVADITSPTSASSSAYYRVRANASLTGNASSSTIYAHLGSLVKLQGGSANVIYAEDGAVIDLTEAGSSNVVLHAPGAQITHSNNVTLIPVNGLAASEIPDFVQIPPLPTINSPSTASAYTGVPFYYVITARFNPTSFTATGLPAGLTIDTTTGEIIGSPTVTGLFNIQLSATNSLGNSTKTLVISIGDPYDYWKVVQFANAVGGTSAPEAADVSDPDGDGSSNLMEFATNTNPLSTDSGSSMIEQVAPVDDYLECIYRRRIGSGTGDSVIGYHIDGIRIQAHVSEDLNTWNSGTTFFEEVGSPIDNGDGTESVTVRLKQPIASKPSSFIRISVKRTP